MSEESETSIDVSKINVSTEGVRNYSVKNYNLSKVCRMLLVLLSLLLKLFKYFICYRNNNCIIMTSC